MPNDKKGTDPDFKPSKGQQSNENWDRKNEDQSSTSQASNKPEERENEDREQLPGKEDLDRGNLTGPGLG